MQSLGTEDVPEKPMAEVPEGPAKHTVRALSCLAASLAWIHKVRAREAERAHLGRRRGVAVANGRVESQVISSVNEKPES